MTKFAFFTIERSIKPKSVKSMHSQDFYDYSVISDFIATVGEHNVISTNYHSKFVNAVSCAIAYRDDELLTCPSCTREISNGFKFCPECGVNLK